MNCSFDQEFQNCYGILFLNYWVGFKDGLLPLDVGLFNYNRNLQEAALGTLIHTQRRFIN